jgi:hypothetical protein
LLWRGESSFVSIAWPLFSPIDRVFRTERFLYDPKDLNEIYCKQPKPSNPLFRAL